VIRLASVASRAMTGQARKTSKTIDKQRVSMRPHEIDQIG
jgi:hypothetical protein